jgi:hypothetical protein
MKALGLAVFALLMGATAVCAELPSDCAVAQHLVGADFGLPRVAKAIAQKKLTVLVVGAGSSTLPGAVAKAYPDRLQAALIESLPGVEVKVQPDTKPGRTALAAVNPLIADLASTRPALVVWQAGTVDAMKSVDADEFSAALDKGIDAAHAADSDVVLLNAQYSPRTESIIALGPYLDRIRWVGLRHDIPVFDRFAIMKLWAELGTFDFVTHTKKLDMAEHVHDCIGRLLADLILKSAKEASAQGAR